MHRIQKQPILQDLKKKMVYLVGPRQVGTPWLAKEIAKDYQMALLLSFFNFTLTILTKQVFYS